MTRGGVKAHAKRVYYCSCGKRMHGNGGRAGHFAMHKKRGDDHRRISYGEWFALPEDQPIGGVP